MLLRPTYLIYIRTFCKDLSQNLKYSMSYKNFKKRFKISTVLNDYIINNKSNHSEECTYDGKIIMITKENIKWLSVRLRTRCLQVRIPLLSLKTKNIKSIQKYDHKLAEQHF